MEEILKLQPYARLLTMLGDQLIKNEIIALVELIKNSYDADADWVRISFENFGENLEKLPNSKIIIEDNGIGMTFEEIKTSWMKPATPNKLSKNNDVKLTPKKKRIIQGEKGIGRFAILKLGKKIKIITRTLNDNDEIVIDFDLSSYDEDFLTKDGKNRDLFIEDIPIKVYSRKPVTIIEKEIIIRHEKTYKRNSGTYIEINDIKGNWSETKLENVSKDVMKLESIFSKIFKKEEKDFLMIGFEVNGSSRHYEEKQIETLEYLLNERAVLKITDGYFDNENHMYKFKLNNEPRKISLEDSMIRGITLFNKRFYNNNDHKFRNPDFGDFKFNFYIFDRTPQASVKYRLDKKDKPILDEHRIYLYRDGIRVYPYGNADDDWLKIDTLRGTYRSGAFFSNDQIVGWIDISKEKNPKLKDKTNREGLIEEGNFTEDFIIIVQTILSYLKLHSYNQYKESIKDKKVQDIFNQKLVQQKFEELKKHIKGNQKALALLKNTASIYKSENDYLTERLKTTEELAGVGLSVETASHDIMMMLSKGINALDSLIKDCLNDVLDKKTLNDELNKIRGMFSFVESQMKDIQLLFKSSKQRPKNIRIKDSLDKIIGIFKRSLKDNKIDVLIDEKGSPVIAKCTDAVILQLFINLIDNAIYWLKTVEREKKNIIVTLEGSENKVIFSDNGPGVQKDDAPYIFEAFFSGKGEEGRGLGLYIASQLLERYDYSIELAELKRDKILGGANFIISFIKSEE